MKPWHTDIQRHIDMWSAKLGTLGWWPQYVYHFTDVHNAVKILDSGCLYSRTEVQRLGLMQVDNASPEIIQQTLPEYFDYVRLYFRPRTPTQYRNEGIRPRTQRQLGGAHCPVPIFFCFDALAVLAQDDTQFSNGNMGSAYATHSMERDFFLTIPFHLVFHHRGFPPGERDAIILHRNAEVLVPNRLPLESALKFIVCRTAAERQTMLHLLPDELRRRWTPRIRIGDREFFERRWTFVEETIVVDDQIVFRFNPSTETPEPFDVSFVYQDEERDSEQSWNGQLHNLNQSLIFQVTRGSRGVVTLSLDDALAFAGTIIFGEIPF